MTALASFGSVVYVGGRFTSIGGKPRSGIAALDATTGDATAWNPSANNAVDAFAISGSTVYVGGAFTRIGGKTRHHIAALAASTGRATAWNPDAQPADSDVGALAVSRSTVYAAGRFERIGGQPSDGIAAVDATTGSATSLTVPVVSFPLYALAVSGANVYVGAPDGVAVVAGR